MEVNELKEKLCVGLEAKEDVTPFRKVEKVLAPFMRTLKQRKHEKTVTTSAHFEELYQKGSPKEILSQVQSIITDPLSHTTLLNETAELLRAVTKSKSVNLYLVDNEANELLLCPKYVPRNPRYERRYTIESGTYLAAYVAFTKEYVISSDILGDVRFPQGIPEVSTVKSVLCVPVVTNDSEDSCIGVIELYRDCSDRPYDLLNLQICTALTSWMGVAMEQHRMKSGILLQVQIRNQICNTAKMYLSGLVPFGKVLNDVVRVSKIAGSAERGAFYVFHEPIPHNSENPIVADVFEEADSDSPDFSLYKKANRVRFLKHQPGIAGYVARTGEIINIRDAYKDPRFDKSTDSLFVRTRAVVGFPIINEKGVVAVLLLINCTRHPYFRQSDIHVVKSFLSPVDLICSYYVVENINIKTIPSVPVTVAEQCLIDDLTGGKFQGFDVFRLAQTEARKHVRGSPSEVIEMTVLRQHLRLIVKDRLIEYCMKPSNEELAALKNYVQQDLFFPDEFFSFDYDLSNYEDEAPKYIAYLFLSLDYLVPYLDSSKLLNFILRVKKAYRPLIFHNFEHAFNVFHCVLTVIIRTKNVKNAAFKPLEVLSMLIAALCHDIDHFGLTNNFIALKNDVIYKLYGDYCGEAYRYNLTLLLIQQSNVLINVPVEIYDTIVKNLKRMILGFDFAIHFQHKNEIIGLLNENKFDWENHDHRFLTQHLALFISDFSYNFKTFDYVKKETFLFYKELHYQGDMEKMMGFTPLAMLDRNKIDVIPENQKILLTVVLLPCLTILETLYPPLSVIGTYIQHTMNKWNEIIALRGLEMWNLNSALLTEKDRRSHRVTVSSTLSSLKSISTHSKITA